MKDNYTHIALVLDRSGSMESVKSDTISGYNAFIKAQQEVPSEATFTLAQFDHEYELLQDFVDISKATMLSNTNYVPRGSTALLDAIGRTMNTVGQRINAMPEHQRPSKVVFAIMTDGFENASREFTRLRIRKMITHQQDVYNWEVIFLSSDINAEMDAISYGIRGCCTLNYAAGGVGTSIAFSSMASNLASYRLGTSDDLSFSDKQKEDAKKS